MTILSFAKLMSRPTILMIFMVLLSLSCTLGIPVIKDEVHTLTGEFIEFVEIDQNDVAYAMLDKNAQSKIDYQSFLDAKDDFKMLIDLFREAGIETRSEDEIPLHVNNLGGKPGGVRFVTVNEDGVWKIANLIFFSSD